MPVCDAVWTLVSLVTMRVLLDGYVCVDGGGDEEV